MRHGRQGVPGAGRFRRATRAYPAAGGARERTGNELGANWGFRGFELRTAALERTANCELRTGNPWRAAAMLACIAPACTLSEHAHTHLCSHARARAHTHTHTHTGTIGLEPHRWLHAPTEHRHGGRDLAVAGAGGAPPAARLLCRPLCPGALTRGRLEGPGQPATACATCRPLEAVDARGSRRATAPAPALLRTCPATVLYAHTTTHRTHRWVGVPSAAPTASRLRLTSAPHQPEEQKGPATVVLLAHPEPPTVTLTGTPLERSGARREETADIVIVCSRTPPTAPSSDLAECHGRGGLSRESPELLEPIPCRQKNPMLPRPRIGPRRGRVTRQAVGQRRRWQRPWVTGLQRRSPLPRARGESPGHQQR
jgi:hypothetical protein